MTQTLNPTAATEDLPMPLTDTGRTSQIRTSQAQALADFDQVVRDHQRGIFRLLLGWTRDEERADALTQETFLRAWRHRDGFRGEAAVGTWLRRIAVHVAEDDRRSRRQGFWRRILRRPRHDEDRMPEVPTPTPSAENSLLGRERLDAVWRAVAALPARQQQVFRLRHLGELSLREIADVLGLAEGTVKIHLHRATHSVRATATASDPSPDDAGKGTP